MIPLHLSIALISAGVALFAGLVSLFTGLHREGDKMDIVFGFLCLSIFIYFIFPPVGFIIHDNPPYPALIIVKRVFHVLFFCLFPWFVNLYTGYKRKTLPVTVAILYSVGYFIMAFAKDSIPPLWIKFVIVAIAVIIVHGFIAVKYQFKHGEKDKAKWFQAAMIIFLVLYVVSAIYQIDIDYFRKILHIDLFYPINLFPLLFITLMGIRLRANSIQKLRLEKELRSKNRQWESLMQHMQLIVVHTDVNGKLNYINPFGVSLLNYKNPSELIGRNWYDYFLPVPEAGNIREIFQKAIQEKESVPQYKNIVVTKDGDEKTITWTTELTFDGSGAIEGLMNLGVDITDQENAFQQIQNMKAELEKENLMLKGEPIPEWMQQEIVGKSDAIVYAIQKAKKVAVTQATVLLEGETGVGKELFADLIQRSSLRNQKPFVKVNCGALPAELIEDELFGHEKGAFTGAITGRKGRFEIADGGTIFLDEIGELPLTLQPKLLRVLQNGEFERVGGQQTIKVDVRVIAATNRSLGAESKNGKFRDDLFYRLNVFPITIPTLRDRKDDIPMLVQFFVERKSKKYGKVFKNINKSDLNHLSQYDWPGNIREMRNVIERAVINSESETIRLDLFYQAVNNKDKLHSSSSLEELEKEHILKVLRETNWRVSGEAGAAEKLGMNPSTLRSRIKKLNIPKISDKENN